MTSDGEGSSRLRIGSWLPEPTIHPPRGVTTAPPETSRQIDAEGHAEEAPAQPARDRRRLWAVAGGVALCAAVAATVAMCSAPPGGPGADGRDAAEAAGAPAAEPATPAEPAETGEARLARNASPTPSHTPARPAFQPIGLEAEEASAELSGPAEVVAYTGASGGRIVQNLGRIGPGAKRTGTLTFPGVTVPGDGRYTLTLYLVNNGTGGSGTVVVTVAGGGSVSVSAPGGGDCCIRTAVTINLRKGPNSVTVGNPDGRAPSLDRIVISAP
jgi:hypothetical protein